MHVVISLTALYGAWRLRGVLSRRPLGDDLSTTTGGPTEGAQRSERSDAGTTAAGQPHRRRGLTDGPPPAPRPTR